MPITLNCPKCHKPFRVRDESIGGRVRCPSCAAILQVPSSLGPSSLAGFDDPAGGMAPPIDAPPQQYRPPIEELRPTPPPEDDDLLGGPSNPPKMEFGAPGNYLPAPPSIKLRGNPSGFGANPAALNPFGANSPVPAPLPMPNPVGPMPYAGGSMSIPPIGSPSQPAPPMRGAFGPITGSGVGTLPKQPGSFIQEPGGFPHPSGRAPIPPVRSEWAAARSGLTLIQAGLVFWMIPFLGVIGHGIWGYLKPAQAFATTPGFLGRPELNFWREIALAYSAVPAALGLLLLFFGRAKCTAVPDHSMARGLARASTFCTLLGVVGLTSAAVFYLGLAGKFKLTPETGPLGLCVAAPAALLADAFTLFFFAQACWATGMPKMLLSVGTFLTFALVTPAFMYAAHLFFPVIGPMQDVIAKHGTPFGSPDAKLTLRFLIAAGAVCLYGIVLLGCYASLAGKTKQAIRQQMGV